MLMKQITDAAFFAKRCHWLNQWIEIRGTEILLLGLVEGRDEIQLWYMARNPESDADGNEYSNCIMGVEPVTQRQRLLYNMHLDSQDMNFSFTKVALDDIEFAVESTSSSGCYDGNIENWMAIQFFCEQGIDLRKWNDVDAFNIHLNCAALIVSEGTDPFEALKNKVITQILLDTNQSVIRRPLPVPLKFSIGLGEIKILTFNDPITNALKQIHLNGIVAHDIWASIEEPAMNAVALNLSDDDFAQWKSGCEDSIATICPKGQMLAMLEYDEETGLQFEFYETAYLESRCISESGVAGWFFGSDEIARGPSGNPYKLAKIRSMDPNETGPFEVELISAYEIMPEERFIFMMKSLASKNLEVS